ncbi:MAG: RtcB family protein [Magnetococcales bacterium]|nr:RtcB family protein [Magnetococcales bacterium]
MDESVIQGLRQISEWIWEHPRQGRMNTTARLCSSPELLREFDEKALRQLCNVASLPGVAGPVWAMPDAHVGFGFPIGGVAAFDAAEGGVVSAGGVGYDISCGVRTLRTGLTAGEIHSRRRELADGLFKAIPSGVGQGGSLHLDESALDEMLAGGAVWAARRGFGNLDDMAWIESHGQSPGADPDQVSPGAKKRQRHEMGTLGSGNHYLEVQRVERIFDEAAAQAYGLRANDVVISLHCGSRALGHQVATDYVKRMRQEAAEQGLALDDPDLAFAPIDSPTGRAYLGAMAAAANCAMANRQIIAHRTGETLRQLFPGATPALLYDVSHNLCQEERHRVDGVERRLHVHRKGATRAFGPGHPELPPPYRPVGQPVLIGGSMGTASYILAGRGEGDGAGFASACHGAGRKMGRNEAARRWDGRQVIRDLDAEGILIRSSGARGVAEEAPGAYKAVDEVVLAAQGAGLSVLVARLRPMICVKG